MMLPGCTTTQPQYPAELQMLIAQSAVKQQPKVEAVTVNQLLASVRASSDKSTHAPAPKNDSWIFNGDSPTLQSNQQNQPNQSHQLRLTYQSGHALPNALQLMQARQLATQTDLTLVTLTIGSCADKSPLVCAGTAQKRSNSLLKVLGNALDKVSVQYDPRLGIDVAVVTFKPRSF
ncbi:MAG: hypothetical protein HRT35_22170 [Algicola sp.]|nr:hypothetical protein [Algicola sp.]